MNSRADLRIFNSHVQLGRNWDLERRILLARNVRRPRRMSQIFPRNPDQPNRIQRRYSLDAQPPQGVAPFDNMFFQQIQANLANDDGNCI